MSNEIGKKTGMNRTSERKKNDEIERKTTYRADERQQMQNIQFFKVHFDCKYKHTVKEKSIEQNARTRSPKSTHAH